jgi:hypothetical protein
LQHFVLPVLIQIDCPHGTSRVQTALTADFWVVELFAAFHGKWQRTGAYEGVDNPLEMIEQIREGKVKVVKPRYQSLQTGDQELNPKLDTTPQP